MRCNPATQTESSGRESSREPDRPWIRADGEEVKASTVAAAVYGRRSVRGCSQPVPLSSMCLQACTVWYFRAPTKRPSRERAEEAGCDTCLPKPCSPDDLRREVQLLLAASKLRVVHGVSTTTKLPSDLPDRRERAADLKVG